MDELSYDMLGSETTINSLAQITGGLTISDKAPGNIGSLPSELLISIFLFARDIFSDEDVLNVTNHKTPGKLSHSLIPPIRISQVSSLWRAIAHSEKHLWSKIYVRSGYNNHNADRVIQEGLLRSKNALLDVRIGGPTWERPFYTKYVPIILGDQTKTTIAQNTNRLQIMECSLELLNGIVAQHAGHHTNALFPVLKVLNIEVGPEPLQETLLKESVPMLTHLHGMLYQRGPLQNDKFRKHFPWKQIRHLDLTVVDWKVQEFDLVTHILRYAYNITSLSLKNYTIQNVLEKKIELKELQKLKLELVYLEPQERPENNIVKLFDILNAPKLTSIDLKTCRKNGNKCLVFTRIPSLHRSEATCASITSFLSRSGCTLEELVIRNDELFKHHEGQEYKDVTKLCLSFPRYPEKDVRYLASYGRRSNVFPKLEELELELDYYKEIIGTQLRSMLRARLESYQPEPHLLSVSISSRTILSEFHRKQIENILTDDKIRTSGVTIAVTQRHA